uniref:NADH-ubiquinone oxidoreductase chain 1 n=1 Tax=Mesohomotoma hibisci TaxID=399243 RepID=A0A344A2K7_9HEMI|nr:NADH dehydrogenase subunit 1 [Mesohomotoma hibisci]
MLLNFFCLFLMMILSLISVAFITLLERKLLGFIQVRKGPTKVGVFGIFQPFSDAVKLFTKEFYCPLSINFYPYWLSPVLALGISILSWVVFPYGFHLVSWKYTILFMFCLMSLSVYTIVISGWFSNSCYSVIGAIRSIAQSVSYEVSFFLMILAVLYFISSMNFLIFLKFQKMIWFIFLLFPVFLMFFVSFLAELNRTPFDFSEGESELVSGFNIEYGGSGFAFIFLAEYLSIIFSSLIIVIFFFCSCLNYFFYLKLMFMSFMILVIRSMLPRYRYDKLMNMCWKSYLSSILCLIIFYSSISTV